MKSEFSPARGMTPAQVEANVVQPAGLISNGNCKKPKVGAGRRKKRFRPIENGAGGFCRRERNVGPKLESWGESILNRFILVDPFDGVTIRKSDGDVVTLQCRKAKALLAYLALKSDLLESRERLAGLLWGDTQEALARAALRQCVRQIRMALADTGSDCLCAGRSFVGLYRDSAGSRTQAIADDLARSVVNPLLLDPFSLPERLLYGFDDLDSGYTAWLRAARQSWRDRVTAGLERLLSGPYAFAATLDAAKALILLDPCHEPAHLTLIAAHAVSGNASAALRQYDRLWEALRQEHDCEPQPQTVALVAAVKLGNFPVVMGNQFPTGIEQDRNLQSGAANSPPLSLRQRSR